MTVSYGQLFDAILAMDAYQQGPDSALKQILLGNAGGVGSATVISDPTNSNFGYDPTHGFFAQAYSYNGQTAISYRGTDQGFAPWSPDFLYGYDAGAGAPDAAQGQDAIAFYNQVLDAQRRSVSALGQLFGGGLPRMVEQRPRAIRLTNHSFTERICIAA